MSVKLAVKYTSTSGGGTGRKMRKAFRAAFDDAKPKIASLIIDHASAEAKKTLRSRASIYVNALKQPDTISLTETHVEVSLKSKIVRAIESGASPWDMKPALLAKATKASKGGVPYVDVPISHSSGAQGVRKAMKASTKKPTLAAKVRGASQALVRNLRSIPARAKVGKGYKPTKARSVRGSKSTSTSTVRRISANSSPSSWWHPGFKPAGILRKTIVQLKPEILAIINSSLAKAAKP